VEKLKDTGSGGLPNMMASNIGSLIWLWNPNMTAPGSFAQLATAYAAKHRVADQDLKRAIAQVSVKSHETELSTQGSPQEAREHRAGDGRSDHCSSFGSL